MVRRVLLAKPAPLVPRVPPVSLVLQVPRDLQVWQDLLVHKVLRVKLVPLVPRVPPE